MPKRAFIVADVQYDFMPDGALPVQGGYDVVPIINDLMDHFELVVGLQDWHPEDHCSFASNHEGKAPGEVVEVEGIDQILWPDHCVQETRGAEFVDELASDRFDKVFRKGTDPRYDSYSGLYDNGHKKATGLTAYLREQDVETVFVAGVATDYCVKFTVLDACRDEFETLVVLDGCRGVINAAGDIEKAVAEMVEAGARVVSSGMVAG
jgi:nicotinamidase/pyrazinamidase